MKPLKVLLIAAIGVFAAVHVVVAVQKQEPPQVKIPDPGVPQIMNIEAEYVRAAYNNDVYVIIGYKIVQEPIGTEWIMLETGMTMRDSRPNYTLTRDHVTLTVPDGKELPLAS